jgi:hypothetical protein
MNEAAMLGTASVLYQLSPPYSPELEEAIQQAVRQALMHYADGLATRERQLHPLQSKGRA